MIPQPGQNSEIIVSMNSKIIVSRKPFLICLNFMFIIPFIVDPDVVFFAIDLSIAGSMPNNNKAGLTVNPALNWP